MKAHLILTITLAGLVGRALGQQCPSLPRTSARLPQTTARDLDDQYIKFATKGDLGHALTALQQEIELRRAEGGPPGADLGGPPGADLGKNLAALAMVFSAQGEWTKSIPCFDEALNILNTTLPPDSPELVPVLNGFATTMQNRGDYIHPGPNLERSLRILARQPTKDPHAIADTEQRYADLLTRTESFDDGRRHADAAAEQIPHIDPPDHLLFADILDVRGRISEHFGEFQRARVDFTQALSESNEDELMVARAEYSLGYLLELQGDYVSARTNYERSLKIRERLLRPDNPDLSVTRANLANILQHLGDYSAAAELYLNSIHYQRKALGDSHPDLATLLGNYADLLTATGDFNGAMDNYREAIDICIRQLPPIPLAVARLKAKLADCLQQQKRYDEAEQKLQEALATQKSKLGTTHPLVAITLNSLGRVYFHSNRPKLALGVLRQALDIGEAGFATNDPQLGTMHLNLALTYQALGDVAAATEQLGQSADILNGFVAGALPALSIAEQESLVESDWVQFVSLLLSMTGADISAAQAEALIQSKGVLVALLKRYETIGDLVAGQPKVAAVVLSLRETRRKLALLRETPSTPLKSEVKSLASEEEELERQLAPSLKAVGPTPSLATVRRELRDDEALIDLYLYDHIERGVPVEKRYAALVLTRAGAIKIVHIGASLPIDQCLDRLRTKRSVGDDVDRDILARAVWAPVGKVLPTNIRRVWLSPDGALCFSPWSLLASVRGVRVPTYITQIDSVREFVSLRTPRPNLKEQSVLIVGDVDYGTAAPASQPKAVFLPSEDMTSETDEVGQIAVGSGLAIKTLRGRLATKRAMLDALKGSGYVHLATHARVSEDPEEHAQADHPRGGKDVLSQIGLALVDANRGEEGLLTADEMLGIDLHAARLVTLAACDTASGSLVVRQGVMGLRSVLMANGANAILLSVWPVPGDAAEVFMRTFYENLWGKKMALAEALRRTQLSLRRDQRFRAPENWAGWITVGAAWE